MIIQEPIKAAIAFSLKNFAYSDAIFLSERLHAEINTDESLYLLAESYYRSGKPNAARVLLMDKHPSVCKSPQCLFLLAKCLFDLEKYDRALETLMGPFSAKYSILERDRKISQEEMISVYGELSSFVAQQIGLIYHRLSFININSDLPLHFFQLSLQINPLLWSSYKSIIEIDPSFVEDKKFFSLDNFDAKYSCGTNPLINLYNNSSLSSQNIPIVKTESNSTTSSTPINQSLTNTFKTPTSNLQSKSKIEISTPFAVIKQSSENNLDVITPETNGNWAKAACLAPTKKMGACVKMVIPQKKFNAALKCMHNCKSIQNPINSGVNRNLSNALASTAVTVPRHAFGVLQLDEQELDFEELSNSFAIKDPWKDKKNFEVKSPLLKRNRRNHQSELQEYEICNNISPTPGSLRRSTRLYSPVNCVKENSTENNKVIRTPNNVKRTKRTLNFEKTTDEKDPEEKSKKMSSIDIKKAGLKVQMISAGGLLELMSKLATASKLLAQYRCTEAIFELNHLPIKHFETGFVLASLGKAYFEIANYDQAIHHYERCRKLEPYRLEGMDLYSTALWHQQKEFELSCLSQALVDFDRKAPQTWCVVGNFFSLQKDHETSITFLKRAIQVDPQFYYAYTLLGYEYIAADEQDDAMSAFRNAIRRMPRHWNASYGMGLISYKQEKYKQACKYYSDALRISPNNPQLLCHMAIVCHHLKRTDKAMSLLERALTINPRNVLIKFHRASINFANEKYNEAMEELTELKQLVPKEGMIYFLIGKIHRARGETDVALSSFQWALEMDPKGANSQIKELVDRHYGSDEDAFNVNNNSRTSDAFISGNSSSLTPFQERNSLADGSNEFEHVPASGIGIASGSSSASFNVTNISATSNSLGEFQIVEQMEIDAQQFAEIISSDEIYFDDTFDA